MNYQKEKRIDLIMMPTLGKGGVTRFYSGGTSEKVVRQAGCPMVVIGETK